MTREKPKPNYDIVDLIPSKAGEATVYKRYEPPSEADDLDPDLVLSGQLLAFEPVLMIHRAPGAMVGLWKNFKPCRKPDCVPCQTPPCSSDCGPCSRGNKCKKRQCPDEGPKKLGAVKASELGKQFELFAQYAAVDGYFNVNSVKAEGYYDRVRKTRPRISRHTGLPTHDNTESEKNFSWLNACYAEIDCYKLPHPLIGIDPAVPADAIFDADSCLWTISKLEEAGEIPTPTMVAQSGRGVYVFWLLRDAADPKLPVPMREATAALYRAVNSKICAYFSTLNCDPKAKNIGRFLRFPGSVHSGAGKATQYLGFYKDPSRQDMTYTLEELAKAFKVYEPKADPIKLPDARTKELAVDTRPASARNLVKRRGYHAQRMTIVDDLESLEKSRGGWPHGMRREALLIYARVNLQAYGPQMRKDILRAVKKMAARCVPPYPSDVKDATAEQIVSDALSKLKHRMKAAALCKKLKVTAEEAQDLELRFIVPLAEKIQRRQVALNNRRPEKIKRRRQAISDIFASRPSKTPPTLRELQALLLKRYGYKVSLPTLSRDTRKLGIAVAEGAPGRPRKPIEKAEKVAA